jgi:CheY-like chemotaxis protein
MNNLRNKDDFAKDDDIVNISSLRADNDSVTFNVIKNVLIVDDAPMNRKMLRRILEDRVEMIYEAEDGQIAVNMIQDAIDNNQQSFDVILMDFVMPNMNGPEATRKIRELGYEGIIIGVTGNTLQSDIDEFKLHGANDVLPKPLDINIMENLLRGNSFI